MGMTKQQKLEKEQEELATRKKVLDAWYDVAYAEYELMAKRYAEMATVDVLSDAMERVSKALTNKFQGIRVTIAFEGGGQKLSIGPVPPKRENPSLYQGYTIERLKNVLKPMSWPDPKDVSLYMEGYSRGFDSGSRAEKDKAQELAEKAARAEWEQSAGHRGMRHMHPMMRAMLMYPGFFGP